MTNEEILNIEVIDHPCGAKTIREYFVMATENMWTEGDEFSGKRPLGSSCWQSDIYLSLVKAGAIAGTIDEYGDLDEYFNYDAADKLVSDAIMHMASERKPEPKRKMVTLESVITGGSVAIDANEVAAISNDGSVSYVYLRGGTGVDTSESLIEVATKIGIELVETCSKA